MTTCVRCRLFTTPRDQDMQIHEYSHSKSNPLLWGQLLHALQHHNQQLPHNFKKTKAQLQRVLRFRALAGIDEPEEDLGLWPELPDKEECRIDQVSLLALHEPIRHVMVGW